MKQEMNLNDNVGIQLERQKAGLRGMFTVELWRDGELLEQLQIPNGITNEGKDYLLDAGFDGGTQQANWYIGLISNSGYSAVAAADTMSSHAGWSAFTNYSESTRPEWAPDAASSQSISNSTQANFNITGSGTLKGIFVTSDNTKSGTSGTLWSTALFSSDLSVVNGDLLKITYTVSA